MRQHAVSGICMGGVGGGAGPPHALTSTPTSIFSHTHRPHPRPRPPPGSRPGPLPRPADRGRQLQDLDGVHQAGHPAAGDPDVRLPRPDGHAVGAGHHQGPPQEGAQGLVHEVPVPQAVRGSRLAGLPPPPAPRSPYPAPVPCIAASLGWWCACERRVVQKRTLIIFERKEMKRKLFSHLPPLHATPRAASLSLSLRRVVSLTRTGWLQKRCLAGWPHWQPRTPPQGVHLQQRGRPRPAGRGARPSAVSPG